MLSKLLFSLVLAVSPIVSVSAQVENADFDTFQTVDKYLADFDYLMSYNYRVCEVSKYESVWDIDFAGERFIYYVFPIYYGVEFANYHYLYYENKNYQFFVNDVNAIEVMDVLFIGNYIGSETEFSFFALDTIGMLQVIEHDKTEKSNSISIYNSFYNFFTGFFPNEVVAEYHGIFTFVIVAFLLFLVFGFVFFLFRVIRRLVGFK